MEAKPRRTQEQIAAEHQRRANKARAKAKKAAKNAALTENLELAQAAKAAGLTAADMSAAKVAFELLDVWFGPRGVIVLEGGQSHLWALKSLKNSRLVDIATLEAWWTEKGWPIGEPQKSTEKGA